MKVIATISSNYTTTVVKKRMLLTMRILYYSTDIVTTMKSIIEASEWDLEKWDKFLELGLHFPQVLFPCHKTLYGCLVMYSIVRISVLSNITFTSNNKIFKTTDYVSKINAFKLSMSFVGLTTVKYGWLLEQLKKIFSLT